MYQHHLWGSASPGGTSPPKSVTTKAKRGGTFEHSQVKHRPRVSPDELMCNLSTPNGNQICFKGFFEVKINVKNHHWSSWTTRFKKIIRIGTVDDLCILLETQRSHLLIASMNSTQLLDGLVSLLRMKCQICSCIEANKCSGFSILNAVGLDGLDSCSGFFSTQCSICMLPPRRFHLGGFLWSMRSSSSMHPSAQRSRGGRPRVRDRMLRRWWETFQNSYTHKKCLTSAFFPINWHLAVSV